MDCIDLFKKAAAAMQTDPRYLELDAARRENDNDQELQGLIGEFNLKRLDLNNESAKPEPDTAHVADLNQQVNDLYTQIMSSEGMVRYNTAKKECEAMVSHIDAIINTAMNGGDPMTVQEACAYLKMPLSTFYYKVKKDDIPVIKQGKHLYIYRDELDKWLESSRKNPAPQTFEEENEAMLASHRRKPNLKNW